MYEESTTKEKILKKVRKALIRKSSEGVNTDFDSEIYQKTEEPLEIIFAKQLAQLNGKFIYCENEKELCANLPLLIEENRWQPVFCFENKIKTILIKSGITFSDNEKDIRHINAGVSLCEYLVARTGSVLLSSRQTSGRRLPVFANEHIVIAFASQVVYSIQDALLKLKKKYGNAFPSMVVNISGPSRTADIEKTLVQGAHGPKELFVFLVDE